MAMNILDILLNNELPEQENKEVLIKRLSKAWETDVVIELKPVSFDRVNEIIKMDDENYKIHMILAGDAKGIFKNKTLMEKYNVPTPAELIKKLFLPGEIMELELQVERLSGYGGKGESLIEEVKKNNR